MVHTLFPLQKALRSLDIQYDKLSCPKCILLCVQHRFLNIYNMTFHYFLT